jgi:hypothetical protein
MVLLGAFGAFAVKFYWVCDLPVAITEETHGRCRMRRVVSVSLPPVSKSVRGFRNLSSSEL